MFSTNIGVPTALRTELELPVTGAEHASCPVTDVLRRRVGDKWSVLVMVLLGSGPRRHGELDRAIQEISQRMLTRTLRGLERDGLVSRTTFPTVPITVEYELTALGRTLLGPLSVLADWAVQHSAEIDRARAEFDSQHSGRQL